MQYIILEYNCLKFVFNHISCDTHRFFLSSCRPLKEEKKISDSIIQFSLCVLFTLNFIAKFLCSVCETFFIKFEFLTGV